jgi:UDP-N-acetylglucosamine--N-acetylmuramyl-(pentapeptide) pyrophosphoryl-undecaprenol N-acetylglucosamine transferase
MIARMPLVLMMAGGTGGHVYPALAVARELLDRGYRVEWVGTARGLEQRVVPAAGITLHHLLVRGVRGKNVLHKLYGVVMLGLASLQALWLVARCSPRCVVGMGGYAAGPAAVAAWLLRRPVVIHEQNAVAGTTNRLLAPIASAIVAGFPGAFSQGVRCEVLGNPIRRELVAAGAARIYDYHGQRSLRLLVLGGSLGALPINNALPGAVRRLLQDGASLEVWHQSGEAHVDLVRARYADLLDRGVKVDPFIEDMASAYTWADLVVCRAGALTVSELAVMGCPAILVPLPQAIDDHQTANARSLTERGGAILLRQSDMSEASLALALEGYLAQPQRLSTMATASRAAARPDAAARVSDRVEELIDD